MLFCLATPVHADTTKEPVISDKVVCVDAHAWGQELRTRGRLREAAQTLAACSRSVCPTIVRKECEAWKAEVENQIPTVSLSVVDGSGRAVSDVTVFLDGEKLRPDAWEHPIQLDPGERLFRFVHRGQVIERGLLVRAGERNRTLKVAFGGDYGSVETKNAEEALPDPAPSDVDEVAPEPESPSASWQQPLGFGLVGAGTLGLVSALYFGLSARSQESDMKDSCAPDCPAVDVDLMRQRYLISDVSLGLGILSGAIGGWLLWSYEEPTSDSQSWVLVGPTSTGAAISVGGAF